MSMNSIRRVLPVFLFMTAMVLFSCEEDKRKLAGNMATEESMRLQEMDVAQAAPQAPDGKGEQAEAPVVMERKLIKDGHITLETTDLEKTKSEITEAVKRFNGYISSENVYDHDDRKQYQITVRVPADNFDALLDAVSASASRVENQSINVMDVTEEYIDVKARLNARQKLESRYLELLSQAKTVEQIVSIEKELSKVREEIESVQGRLKYLDDRIDQSTLHITFYETVSSDLGFGTRFISGLKSGWNNLLWFMIGLVHIWPFVLISIVGLVLLVRYLRKRG